MSTSPPTVLDLADAAYRRRDWRDALALYKSTEDGRTLGVDRLERMAACAGMLAEDDKFLEVTERIYARALELGRIDRGARAAFFLGLRLGILGETGRSAAWMQRAGELVDAADTEISAKGLLLFGEVRRLMAMGELAAAEDAARRSIAIGLRCDDGDCVAFARCLLGQVLIRDGRVEEGLAALDETMLAVSAGLPSPVLTGVVYCQVIAVCRQVYAHGRSREWTEALTRWCDAQPQLVEFHGVCRLHRAEILELSGSWDEAVAEARSAAAAAGDGPDPMVKAGSAYQLAEVARLQGRLAEAERLYTDASRLGLDPQPGLALLRAAQGHSDQALRSLRRAVESAPDDLVRARLLPAAVEVALSCGAEPDAARAAAELETIAARYGTELLRAMADQAAGCVALAERRAAEAIPAFRRAFTTWQAFGAPYIAARIRMRIGAACAALGDAEGARMEREAARACFVELGAARDVAEADAELGKRPADALTPREREVMRWVAEGETNRAIAERLGLSEKTVDRHVSNIFDKFGVSSRAAATAHALRHGLLDLGETTQLRRPRG